MILVARCSGCDCVQIALGKNDIAAYRQGAATHTGPTPRIAPKILVLLHFGVNATRERERERPDVEASARVKAPVPSRRSPPIRSPLHGRRGNARRHRQPRAAPTGSRGVQWPPVVRRGGLPHGGFFWI